MNMNTLWSDFVQGVETLYRSRALRFCDLFSDRYQALFALDRERPLHVLEIGCGPGALAEALHRWYPNAHITALDRDTNFIRTARERIPGVTFVEGDATALPYPADSFDVTISNTVAEHIEPSRFYGEQLRVLRPGGVALVLSSRRGIHVPAPCLTPTAAEQAFWQQIEQQDTSWEQYDVCRYPMNEAELPQAMESNGFSNVACGYVTVPLTPDDPRYSPALATAMIEAQRYTELESLASAGRSFPHVSTEQLAEMARNIHARYDQRLDLYRRGERQWDTSVSLIMVIRGMKSTPNHRSDNRRKA